MNEEEFEENEENEGAKTNSEFNGLGMIF